MANVKLPLSVDGGDTCSAYRCEETRLNGSVATEITFPINSSYMCFFNGNYSQCGYVSPSSGAEFSSDAFTIEFWMKFSSLVSPTSNNPSILGKYDYGNNNRCWAISVYNSGYLRASLSPDGTTVITYTTDSIVIGVDTWYHVAFTYDGAYNGIFYVDGVAKDTSKSSQPLSICLISSSDPT